VILVTFGQPRTLYSMMPQNDRLLYIRVVHPRDPVPHYPPRLWGFRHGGRILEVAETVPPGVWRFRVLDHSIKIYSACLTPRDGPTSRL
jgi:hypothetical protein